VVAFHAWGKAPAAPKKLRNLTFTTLLCGVRVVVVTTSYPRYAGDPAGVFVRDAVEAVRTKGVQVEVVSPASVNHHGIAYGDGIPQNLRSAPWKVPLVPVFMASLARATRRAARQADLVHAHWLPSGLAAAVAGKPFVVQLWGTDVELADRVPRGTRLLLERARLVLCASKALAEAAGELGAREVRVVPAGVEIPVLFPDPDEPPHVLYVGRLSEEKGVLELIEAARGLPLVVVGDGPLRDRVPGAVGFVPPAEVGAYLARAAVVVCPSRREGYGIVARQALAHGRPVVATRVGGLLEVVVDGETGLLVPPRDPSALRQALERLLGDESLRRRLGAAGRWLAEERLSLDAAAEALLAAYADALRI
jgi:glycosyltransferase involved in cell wall biosynthesis